MFDFLFDVMYEEMKVEFMGRAVSGCAMSVVMAVVEIMMFAGLAVLISSVLMGFGGVSGYVNGSVSWMGSLIVTRAFVK